MKIVTLILLCLYSAAVCAQEIAEKEIQSEVNEVTVFIDKAQITRTKTVELSAGAVVLKFVNLSPFIDAKSVQVKAKGNVTVLSVSHQQNFLDKLNKSADLEEIEGKIKQIDEKIELEATYLSILKDELTFLNDNRVIGGKNNALAVATLKEATAFYSTQLHKLKLQQIEKNKTLQALQIQKREYRNQLNTLSSKKEFPSGEVWVKVLTTTPTNPGFELSYLVGNAGWYPSYDIRAKTINNPVEIIYKANVRQDSKVDWNDVKLKFSSSNPSSSGVAPVLKTYYLDYYSVPPSYKQTVNSVSGRVTDENNEPLTGATVVIPGTTIGVVTDFGGNYSLMLPGNATSLNYAFIGYESQTLPIKGAVINAQLQPDFVGLEEVVAVGYDADVDADFSYALEGRVAGVSVQKSARVKKREAESIAIPFEYTEKQTTVEFEINTPYSLKSDNKSFAVDMAVFDVPASYQYFSIPKINTDAFLIANISDWEKYNLLEGEANLFFEETYVGKSILDVRNATDTLQLSLGIDKNVNVKREKVKDLTARKFMGSKKVETRGWEITIKNNKRQAINMVILDQVPVPSLEEIEVEILENSGGKYTKDSGEVKWEFSISELGNKKLDLNYSVKYPKSRSLIIE